MTIEWSNYDRFWCRHSVEAGEYLHVFCSAECRRMTESSLRAAVDAEPRMDR